MADWLRRLKLGLLFLGVALVGAGAVTASIAQRTQVNIDHTLQVEVEEHAAATNDYFDRARDIMLVSAQNPAFQRFYTDRDGRARKIAGHIQAVREVEDALAYLQVLYPGRIGEACFIDGAGPENARVVRGTVASAADLSPDESKNPFFRPTMALRPGQVFQSLPYVSPDTGEWVVSNATLVPGLPAGQSALVHFEVTIESIRKATAPDDAKYIVQIVDRPTGYVITDSRFPQRIGAPLGKPTDLAMMRLLSKGNSTGIVTAGSRRIAYQLLSRPAEGESESDAIGVNQNDWAVVVSTTEPVTAWSRPFGPGPVGLAVVGLLTLALAGLGYRRHHGELYERARTDDLTGLPNRLWFRERLAAMIAESTSRPGAVLLLDLDRFKVVNDTLGHQAGDQLLVEIADRLRRGLEPSQHLIARLGGDEFAVLVQDMPDEREAARVAATIQQIVRGTTTVDGVAVAMSTSIGIALLPRHGNTPARLLRCADVAMYAAKRGGSGYSVYTQTQERHTPATLGLEVALLGATERREFELHYQPSIDPVTGDVVRVEALLRWRQPEVGLIPPATFLPLAEEIGMMHELTRHVLELALDQCARWRADGIELPVAVNLAAENCTDPALAGEIAAMLDARNLEPGMLRLEITEHAALAPQAGEVLARLRALGISLALDDFGTGYSSLSYLKSLPVDELKIDRSFVAAIERDESDAVIIRAAIEMAHGLGHTVTAEGVETQDALRILTGLGVDTVQGYHLCRPLPPAELAQWLKLARWRLLAQPAGRTTSAAGSSADVR